MSADPQPVRRAGASGTRPATTQRRQQLLVDVLAVLDERYAEPDLSLGAVARQVGSAPRQLQRVFTEVAKSGFRHELAAVRMRHAAELLQTTPLAVKEIAWRVGYSSPAQLATVFRRHYGLTPTAFRRRTRSA